MDAVTWIEMCEALKKHGFSEKQIAEFNRLSVVEYRLLRASRREYLKSALDGIEAMANAYYDKEEKDV